MASGRPEPGWGQVTPSLSARRVVIAGDVFAMGLVVAYLWEPFHRVAAAHPGASLRAYVDDAQL